MYWLLAFYVLVICVILPVAVAALILRFVQTYPEENADLSMAPRILGVLFGEKMLSSETYVEYANDDS